MSDDLLTRLRAMRHANNDQYQCCLSIAEVGEIIDELQTLRNAHKLAARLIRMVQKACAQILGDDYDDQVMPLARSLEGVAAEAGCNPLQAAYAALDRLGITDDAVAQLAVIAAYAELKAPILKGSDDDARSQ